MLKGKKDFSPGTRFGLGPIFQELMVTIRREYGGDITLNQLLVLMVIIQRHVRNETTRGLDIVAEINMPKATVSRAIKVLATLGAVTGRPGEEDARERYVIPSPELLRVRQRFYEGVLSAIVES